MKRSEINRAIRAAEERLAAFRIRLPDFAYWTPAEWEAHRGEIGTLARRMLGWDVTDFGRDRFAEVGAVLFTVRNGDKDDPAMRQPYCEKYIIMSDNPGQWLPMHYHVQKTEDIINRAGGTLLMQLYHKNAAGGLDTERPVRLFMDGIPHTFAPGEIITVTPGNSATLEPGIYHRFGAKPGDGMLIVGEVSKVNDDHGDNVFLEPMARFGDIVEDEPPAYPLVNEYKL